MHNYFIIIIALILAAIWYRVSALLFAIHQSGIEESYTEKYETMFNRTFEEKKRRYYLYITFLWGLEVLCGVGTVITVAMLLCPLAK